jgi:hypothetical protein
VRARQALPGAFHRDGSRYREELDLDLVRERFRLPVDHGIVSA